MTTLVGVEHVPVGLYKFVNRQKQHSIACRDPNSVNAIRWNGRNDGKGGGRAKVREEDGGRGKGNIGV